MSAHGPRLPVTEPSGHHLSRLSAGRPRGHQQGDICALQRPPVKGQASTWTLAGARPRSGTGSALRGPYPMKWNVLERRESQNTVRMSNKIKWKSRVPH